MIKSEIGSRPTIRATFSRVISRSLISLFLDWIPKTTKTRKATATRTDIKSTSRLLMNAEGAIRG